MQRVEQALRTMRTVWAFPGTDKKEEKSDLQFLRRNPQQIFTRMKIEMSPWWFKYKISITKVEYDHVSLGAEFRKRRKQERISLRAVASKVGQSAPYISDLELGRRPWNDARIKTYEFALAAIGAANKCKEMVRIMKNQKPTGDFLIGTGKS